MKFQSIVLGVFILFAPITTFAQKPFSHVWFIQGIDSAYEDARHYPSYSDTPEIDLELALLEYNRLHKTEADRAKALYEIHKTLRVCLVHYLLSNKHNPELFITIKKTYLSYIGDEKSWNHVIKLFNQRVKQNKHWLLHNQKHRNHKGVKHEVRRTKRKNSRK